MPYFPIVLSADRRHRTGLANLRTQNWFPQPLPAEANKPVKAVLIPTPGRVSRLDMETTIQGIYQENGVRGGLLFVVAGGKLYSVSSAWAKTEIGSVSTSGLAIFAGLRDKLYVSVGGLLWGWDGSTLTQVTDVDLPVVESMLVLAQRLVVSEPDADTISWSDTLDGTAIDALAFATAEQRPDVIYTLIKTQGQFIAAGATSFEVFRPTGVTSLPFANVTAQTIDDSEGILSRTAWAALGDTVCFVGGNLSCYAMSGFAMQQLPVNVELEGDLRAMSEADRMETTCWAYQAGGHKFFVVRPKGKQGYVIDISTLIWHNRKSWDVDTYKPRYYTKAYGYDVTADEEGTVLYTFDSDLFTDGGDPVERIATLRPAFNSYETIGSMCIDLQAFGRPGSGQGSAPLLMVDISTDGRTNRDDTRSEVTVSIGADGTFLKPVLWGLGQMNPGEGGTFTYRLTDPIGLSLFGAWLNEGQRS